MVKHIQSTRFLVLCAFIVLAALSRIIPIAIPSLGNFTALGALAIFAGAQFTDRRLAFAVPIVAMFLSDIYLGFHSGMPVVYAGFVAMVACGLFIRSRVKPVNIALASIAGAFVFFLITNFAFLYPWYPHNFQGVIESYVAGLPFLRNMLIADAIYGTLMFGVFYLLERRFTILAVK